jgi:hypothetical protein
MRIPAGALVQTVTAISEGDAEEEPAIFFIDRGGSVCGNEGVARAPRYRVISAGNPGESECADQVALFWDQKKP